MRRGRRRGSRGRAGYSRGTSSRMLCTVVGSVSQESEKELCGGIEWDANRSWMELCQGGKWRTGTLTIS